MQISADGTLLVCTNRDNGTASVVDLATQRTVHEIELGLHPEGVTFLGESTRCAACVYGDDKIVFFDAGTGELAGSVDVFDEPYGIVATRDGRRVFACLEFPGRIIEVDADKKEVVREFPGGAYPRGLAISSDDATLYVTEYLTGTVRAFDLAAAKEVRNWPGASTDNLARQIVLHPTLDRAYVPHIRSKIDVAHGSGSIFPYVGIVDTDPQEDERPRKRIPMDSFRGVLVTANPWECGLPSRACRSSRPRSTP
jgi:YVTN family beta-propeller protein